jgi:urease accessory protein UreF
MTRRSLSLLVLVLAIGGTLVVSAGPAYAREGGRGASKAVLIQAAATYLGVTKENIASARRSGQTLAQLAVARGKTVAGLGSALVAAGTASINAAVNAGRITSAQGTAKKAALLAQVERLITSTGGSCSKGDSDSDGSSFRGRGR